MNNRAMWAVAKKDIRGITSNIQIWLPMIVVPLILGVVLPGTIVIVARVNDLSHIGNVQLVIDLIDKLKGSPLYETLRAFPTLNHQIVYLTVTYLFAPFFLLIPIMASSVVAANSFVGEKERKTLESLLLSPIDMKSLFVGKLLSAFIPAIAISLLTFVLYGIVVNLTAYPLFEAVIFPTWNWILLIVWVIPVISLTVIFLNVLISAKVKGYQEAYQLGGLVVLPVIALIVSQLTGLLFLSSFVSFAIGLVLLLVNVVLLQKIAKKNNRITLSEKQI